MDGELPALLDACVESHVKGCEECAGRVAALRLPLDLLRSWPQVPPAHLEAMAGQREELVRAFTRACDTRAALQGRGTLPVRRRLLAYLKTAARSPAAARMVRWTSDGVRWGLTTAAGLAERSIDWLGGAGDPPSRRGRPEYRRSGTAGRLRQRAFAVGGVALRACFRAGRGVIALG